MRCSLFFLKTFSSSTNFSLPDVISFLRAFDLPSPNSLLPPVRLSTLFHVPHHPALPWPPPTAALPPSRPPPCCHRIGHPSKPPPSPVPSMTLHPSFSRPTPVNPLPRLCLERHSPMTLVAPFPSSARSWLGLPEVDVPRWQLSRRLVRNRLTRAKISGT